MSQTQKSPVGAGPICKANSSRGNTTKLSARMQRLLKALMRGPQTTRDLIDAIPANNPGAYVQTLRKCHGLDIPLERVPFTTIDGTSSWYGSYHLTPEDRKKAADLLQG